MMWLGVLLCAAGVIWALQGAGLLPGSFMAGDRTWVAIGAATAAAGLALLYRAFRG